jgi:hypothetical protein
MPARPTEQPRGLRSQRRERADRPDGRADSWTNSDGILEKLGYNAVMFVDVGRVAGGDRSI